MTKRKKIAHLETTDDSMIFSWWLESLKLKRICTVSPSENTFFNANLHCFEKVESTIKKYLLFDINGLEINDSLTYFIQYFLSRSRTESLYQSNDSEFAVINQHTISGS